LPLGGWARIGKPTGEQQIEELSLELERRGYKAKRPSSFSATVQLHFYGKTVLRPGGLDL
jgi:hypothetical protein